MTPEQRLPERLFAIEGQVALVTGGSGALGGALAKGLARAGARVVALARHLDACERVAAEIRAEGGAALGVAADVFDRDSLRRAAEMARAAFGPISILVNGAGGNAPEATTTAERPFFELPPDALEMVMRSNFSGVVACCQVFGRQMVEQGHGSIVNLASLSGIRPLTRVAAYSAAKAAVINFTQWLATHLAQEYSPDIRVNAIAPGFFLTEQNRYLLTDPASGGWTPRGEAVLAHTPMRRLGAPDDLVGTALWLVSPASAFVTGVVVPVDGGFAAYSGV